MVVGPSGAGKDTLIAEALKRRPDLHYVRRVITRPDEEDGGTEKHIPIDIETFKRRKREGAFLLHWDANGYHYGVPPDLEQVLASGTSAVLNGSRGIVAEARRTLAPMKIILVTARLDDMARRLRARGREDDAAIERRLARAGRDVPTGADVSVVDNSGSIEEGVNRFLAALKPG